VSSNISAPATAGTLPIREFELVPVLFVTPNMEDHTSLRKILDGPSWEVFAAYSCREARAFIESQSVPVVICERALPDGDWQVLLDAIDQLPRKTSLIVVSRVADEQFWAEVLNLGGYDVLLTPLEETEVLRVTHSAWRSTQPAASPCPRMQKMQPGSNGHQEYPRAASHHSGG
jgi:DNA-binding NtrC family response regulator